MQYAVHHNEACASELLCCSGVEIATEKPAAISKRFVGVFDIGLINVKANVIDAIRKMANDIARPAADIDYPHLRA